MHTLQNDILTQIMAKHIRQRKYIDVFRLGVGCIIVFGEGRAWRSGRACLPWIVLHVAVGASWGQNTDIRGVVFVVLGLFAYVTDVT